MMKLYKTTIIVTSIMAICFFVISIGCEFIKFAHNAIIQTYASGIACSLLVVIVTTYLQFKHEQNSLIGDALFCIKSLFFYRHLSILSLDPEENTSKAMWEEYYDKIDNNISEAVSYLLNIEFFSKNKKKMRTDLSSKLMLLRVEGVKRRASSKENAVKRMILDTNIEEIKNLSLDFIKSSYVKDEIIDYYKRSKEEIHKLALKTSNEVEI